MEILGANRYSTVFVGNSGDDIEAAQNAGIRAILIDRGEYPYKGPVPSEIIENLYQLKDLLAQTPEYLHIP